MNFLLALVFILGFPALTTRLARRGRTRSLILVTTAVIGLAVVYGLAVASSPFGNRQAASQGYGVTAAWVLLMVGLTIVAPAVISAIVVHHVGRGGRSAGLVYAAGLAAACGGWALGVVLFSALIWR